MEWHRFVEHWAMFCCLLLLLLAVCQVIKDTVRVNAPLGVTVDSVLLKKLDFRSPESIYCRRFAWRAEHLPPTCSNEICWRSW